MALQRIGSVYWHYRAFLLPKLQACMQGKLPSMTDGRDLVNAGLWDKAGDFLGASAGGGPPV